jgi:hypothetical protein
VPVAILPAASGLYGKLGTVGFLWPGRRTMTATALQAWVVVIGALLAGVLGVLKYFNYRTHRDRISLVGEAFNSTVEGLSSDADAKKLAAAILLRRFFDEGTEQGAAGTPYEREAVAVIAALLRNTQTGELQKLLADGLAYASSLQGADLQECNLSRAYLGQRPRSAVTHGSLRLIGAGRWARSPIASIQGKPAGRSSRDHANRPLDGGPVRRQFDRSLLAWRNR